MRRLRSARHKCSANTVTPIKLQLEPQRKRSSYTTVTTHSYGPKTHSVHSPLFCFEFCTSAYWRVYKPTIHGTVLKLKLNNGELFSRHRTDQCNTFIIICFSSESEICPQKGIYNRQLMQTNFVHKNLIKF